ncbi:MAG: ATP synthase F1 subunit gamma [Candidatus Gracilibacteria bacterium]
MASPKEIKSRIKSVKNTVKITRAMELISTVKMKKAQEKVFSLRPFAREANILLSSLPEEVKFDQKITGNKTLIIAIGSSKGLCGGYNISIFRALAALHKSLKGEICDYITIGKKARDFVARTGGNIVEDFDIARSTQKELAKQAKNLSRSIIKLYQSGEYSRVVIVYNHYFSAISQVALTKTILPMTAKDIREFLTSIDPKYHSTDHGDGVKNITLEPSVGYLIERMIPFILDIMIEEIYSETLASEHAARMFAMKNAKDAAGKKVKTLTVSYNKSRQSAITKEVSEIVSGVESLKEVAV